MVILVMGLGSMGKRRIRLLKQYIEQEADKKGEWKIIGVDLKEERCNNVQELFGICTYGSMEEALKQNTVDCAIISTAPLSHGKIIESCLRKNLHVFTELNLTTALYDRNMALAEERKRVLFLSSTFLYRKEIQYIKEQVQKHSFLGAYRYHSGQYLPDWHPWESYREYFIGEKETNGCREIMTIELPWLIDTFGEVKAFHKLSGKISSLDIDYHDCYQILLEHENGVTGTFTVDLVTPKAGRELEIWEEKFYLGWKGTPNTLEEYDEGTGEIRRVELYDRVDRMEGYNQSIVENAYYDELEHFLSCISRGDTPRYTFEQDKKILSLIDAIEMPDGGIMGGSVRG